MLCCEAVYNMKQTSPNQPSEMYQWSIQLREHLAHLLLPQGTNCSLSSVCITPSPTTEGYKAILTSLEQQNHTIDKIQGDGNCMFRSLSKELFGSEKYHLDLRKLVTDFEYCNLQLQPESSSKETCMHYINNMKMKWCGVQLQNCFHLLQCYKHPSSHLQNLECATNVLGISSNQSAYRNCPFTILL